MVVNADNLLVGNVQLPQGTSLARGVVQPVAFEDVWEDDQAAWADDVTMWAQGQFSPTDDSLMLTAGDWLYAIGQGSSADGQPVIASIERLSMRLSTDNVKHNILTQVVPRISGQAGDVITIRLGSQDYFGQPISWNDPQQFTIGQSRAINDIIDGRYLSIQFSGSTLGVWNLFSYFVKITEAGEY